MNNFLSALSILTRIPIKRKFTFKLDKYCFWAPFTGLLIFIFIMLLYEGFRLTGISHTLVILLIFPVQYLLFNIFHFDGLVDTADAFFSYTDKKKKLEILKDSRVGAFGLYAGITYLVSKYLILLQFDNFSLPYTVFLYPVAGRLASSVIPIIGKPAKDEGLGALLKNISGKFLFLFILLLTGLYCIAFFSNAIGLKNLMFSSLSLVLATVVSALTALGIYRKIGGYTGDALGFSIEVGELLYLLILIICYQL